MAKRRTGIHGREGTAGWVFTAPAVAILGVFLFAPIVMALWVSMTNWTGNVDPFGGGPNAAFVGPRTTRRCSPRMAWPDPTSCSHWATRSTT